MSEATAVSATLYSEYQKRVLAILPYLTAPLSVLGSSAIIYVLIKEGMLRKRASNPSFGRLMLGLSTMDIVFSFTILIFGSWAVPEGSPYAYNPRGSTTTCNIAGFFMSFTI